MKEQNNTTSGLKERRTKVIHYATIAGIILAVISLYWYCSENSSRAIAEDGNRISEAIEYQLPDYVVTNSDDNLDRSASAWDNFNYTIRFKNPKDVPAMENDMMKLCEEGGHWEREDSVIYYKAVNGDWDNSVEERFATSRWFSVYFHHIIGTNEAEVSYYLDEIF